MPATVLEDEQANGGREIAVLPLDIDARHELREMHVEVLRDHPQFIPEDIFETDAGLVPPDHDRTLYDTRPQIFAGPARLPSFQNLIVNGPGRNRMIS